MGSTGWELTHEFHQRELKLKKRIRVSLDGVIPSFDPVNMITYLADHPDYVHWNPMKHGLVRRLVDWPCSSFHRYVRLGLLPMDWDEE